MSMLYAREYSDLEMKRDISSYMDKYGCSEKEALKAFRIRDLFDTKNADEVEALMRNGGDAKILNSQGNSPLFYYRSYKHAEALLKAGVDATVKNKDGNTALHGVRDEKTAEALMNAGCSYKELNNEKETPLMSIMKNNNAQPEVINKLAAMDYSDLPADVRAKQDEMLKQYAATHSNVKPFSPKDKVSQELVMRQDTTIKTPLKTDKDIENKKPNLKGAAIENNANKGLNDYTENKTVISNNPTNNQNNRNQNTVVERTNSNASNAMKQSSGLKDTLSQHSIHMDVESTQNSVPNNTKVFTNSNSC